MAQSKAKAAPPLPERAPDDLVRLPEVKRRTGLSRPTIYRKIAGGTFPRQVQLSVNCVGWYEAEISSWLSDPARWCQHREVV